MSNVLSLSSVKNRPSRNTFPLESHRLFSAKAGELLPVYWRLTYPDDEFELRHQHFIRTNPVNTAAFARFRTYLDWYYVPLRLINKNIAQALVDMQDNPVQASSLLENKQITLDLPYAPVFGANSLLTAVMDMAGRTVSGVTFPRSVNFFGFGSAPLSFKLLNCLGYGSFSFASQTEWSTLHYSTIPFSNYPNASSALDANLLPLFAYQKIYCDYFRFEQWEKSEPFTYNCDYYSGGNLLAPLSVQNRLSFAAGNNFLTLRYANWMKDMYMGVLPNSQLGSVSAVTMTIDNPSSNPNDLVLVTASGKKSILGTNSAGSPTELGELVLESQSSPTSESGTLQLRYNISQYNSQFNILQLRMAEALQKYREISQANGQGYVEQVAAHWGYKLSQALSDHCVYIGGSSSNINISEVENTNLTEIT